MLCGQSRRSLITDRFVKKCGLQITEFHWNQLSRIRIFDGKKVNFEFRFWKISVEFSESFILREFLSSRQRICNVGPCTKISCLMSHENLKSNARVRFLFCFLFSVKSYQTLRLTNGQRLLFKINDKMNLPSAKYPYQESLKHQI